MLRLLNPLLLASACLGLILAAAVRADDRKDGKGGDKPPAAALASPEVEDAQDEVELRELRLELKKDETAEARANLDLATKNLARAEELVKAAAISADELDQKRAAVDLTKAQLRVKDVEVREAEIRLRQAQRRLDRARAAAPKPEK